MIFTTQIVRLDGMRSHPTCDGFPSEMDPLTPFTGLILVASVDDQQAQELGELKSQIRQVVKRITPSSEPRASIESSKYTMQ